MGVLDQLLTRTSAPPAPAAPAPPVDYREIVQREALAMGVDPALALRMLQQESGGRPNARSPKGALGLFQLMPETAAELGVDPADPVSNIRGGLTYLKRQLDANQGDVIKALAAYNAGPGNVRKYGGVPPFKETRDYVQKVGGVRKVSAAGVTMAPPDAAGAPGAPVAPVESAASSPAPQGVNVPLPGGQPLRRVSAAQVAPDPSSAPPPGRPGQPLVIAPPGMALPEPSLTPGPIPAPPNQPSVIEDVTGFALPTGGGMAGTAAGASIGAMGGPLAPVTIPLGAVIGAGVGSMAGEGAQMGVETLGAKGAPTFDEAKRRLTEAGVYGAVGEGLFRPLGWAVRRLMRGRFLPPVDKVAEDLYRRTGGEVLPSQTSNSPTMRMVENVLEGSLFGGGQVKAIRTTQQKELAAQAMDEILKFGPPLEKEAAGTAVWAARNAGLDQFTADAAERYGKVQAAAKGVQIPVDRILERSDELLTPYIQEVGDLAGPTGLQLLNRLKKLAPDVPEEETIEILGGKKVTEALADPKTAKLAQALVDSGVVKKPEAVAPTPRSFEELSKLRSDLISMISEARAAKQDKVRGVAQQMLKEVDGAIDEALPPDARRLWREANAFYKQGKQLFENKYMRSLAQKDPSQMAHLLTAAGAGNSPEKLRQFRTAVGAGPWTAVQSRVAQTLLAAKAGDDVVQGTELIKRLTSMGNERLREIFPDGNYKGLWEFARVLERTQKGSKAGTEGVGRVAIQLAQGGAAMGLVTFTGDPKAGLILLAPAALSKLLLNPRTRRYLIQGLKDRPGTQTAIEAAGQILATLGRDRDQRDKAGERPTLPPMRRGGPAPSRPVSAPPGRGPGGG